MVKFSVKVFGTGISATSDEIWKALRRIWKVVRPRRKIEISNNVVGMENEISQILKLLKDDKVGVIGIHGMGGAGKTTLAKQIVDILSSSPSSIAADGGKKLRKFHDIIWATVSQNRDTLKLQEEIAVQLGLHENSGFKDKDASVRARFLSSHLSERRFLLVLDDVWKEFDLSSIGIPQLVHGKKLLLTTREEKVCTGMNARKSRVKVGCLGEKDSWELFKKTMQRDDSYFKELDVYEIARKIVRNCRGLPLVLITIARVMDTNRRKLLWEHIEKEMKGSPHVAKEMEHVYELLEISFNNLRREECKDCLLYSALFPEDWEIDIATLVDYCIGGGSVSNASSSSSNVSDDWDKLRCEGELIISELIGACLLERGRDEEHVKVHDAIRDMILSGFTGRSNNGRILSYAGKRLTEKHNLMVGGWETASMLSFMANDISEFSEISGHGYNLRVLLLNRNSKLRNVPRSLFQYCPNLRVLDLSNTGIQEIPASVGSLQSLRYLNLSRCRELKSLPEEMGALTNLIHLNLSHCYVLKSLPEEMGALTNLIHLDLSRCTNLKSLPEEMGALTNLIHLNLSCCRKLKSLPEEMALTNLIHLDLSWCPKLESLPEEMGALTNLIHLDLSFTRGLCEIPNGLFSSLSKLQFLDLMECEFFERGGSADGREKFHRVFKEMGNLSLLKDVLLSIPSDVVKFVIDDEFHSLSNFITNLKICEADDVPLKYELFKRMGSRLEKLQTLTMDDSCRIEECGEDFVIDDGHFSQLKTLHLRTPCSFHRIVLEGRPMEQLAELTLDHWDGLMDLAACLPKLPNLKKLWIFHCAKIVELMGPSQATSDGDILPKLESIKLHNCPNLKRIFGHRVLLQSLEYLEIWACPSLEDISTIDSPNEVKISCFEEWWEDLRWEHSGEAPPSNFILAEEFLF